MKAILLATIVAFAAATPTIKEQWASFKRQHGKSYHSIEEENFRMNIFLENLKKIEEHNAKYDAGHETFSLGMNHFGDMLPEEVLTKFNQSQVTSRQPRFKFSPPANVAIPESIDWRESGAVTPIKNQGLFCGSCWAFSTTGAIEGQLYRKSGELVSLSEQQLVDCSRNYQNQGCNGGLMDNAFQYLHDVEGLESEDSYPYEAADRSCRYNADNVVPGTKVKAYVDIKQQDDDALRSAVATVGPISVGISADGFLFLFYRSGIFSGYFCSGEIDHGVVLVGYGTNDDGSNYWIIKNSWGRIWGDKGYMKLSAGYKNNCGISSMASYPILE